MSDKTIESTPWIRRKSTLVGGLTALAIVVVVAAIKGNPEGDINANTAGGLGAATNQKGNGSALGTAGQSAEFNQTFAARLREEQAAESARINTELRREMEARFTAESERTRAESLKQNEEVIKRMEALTQAQNEANAALAERNRIEAIKSLKFVQPRAPTGVPSSAADPLDSSASAPSFAVRNVIPPNGFVKGRLLNGVVATLGEAPTAFLVALEGTYKAANGVTVNLNGCMATVEGRPNLAAGRIDGKPAEITCNFENEGRVQTWQVGGWIVDAEDGIRGLSSVIVDNTGKKITAAAAASALAAAGNALNESQYSTTTNTTSGTSSRVFTGSAGSVFAGNVISGAGQGVQTALAEHYALYKPTLQKGANSAITLVLTNELVVPQQGRQITQSTNLVEVKK